MRSALPGRYVGRVGALAVALGVGGILSPAIASADDTPDRPSHASHAADRAATSIRTAPNRAVSVSVSVPGARTARPSASKPARGDALVSTVDPAARPTRREDPTAPVALPVAWAGAAATRREFSGATRIAAPAAAPDPIATPTPNLEPLVDRPVLGAALSVGSILDPLISAAAESFVRYYFPDSRWAPLVGHVAPIVVDGVADWIFNGTVSDEVDRLASDPVVLQAISDVISEQVAGTGMAPEAGVAVGNAAATWVNLAFSGPQGEEMRGYFDTLLNSLPGLPNGWDTAELLVKLAVGTYTFDQLIDDQLGMPLQTGIDSFLAEPRVQLALSTATAGAVSVLLGTGTPSEWTPANPQPIAVAASVGDQLGALVANALLGAGPDAAGVRASVGGIIARLFANTALTGLAVDTAGTTVATLLGQPAIRGAVAISAANAVRAFFGVAQVSMPTLQDAIETTVTNGVSALLADTPAIAAVGRTFQDVFAWLTSNSAVQVLIGDVFAVSLGQGAGQAVSDLLATPGFRDGLASALGDVPMNLLGGEDVRAAVAVAFGQLARDIASGAAIGDATGPALRALLETAAVRQALGSTATRLVIDVIADLARWAGTVVQEPASRALADYAGTAVTGFIDYPGISTVLTDTVDGVVTSAIEGTDSGNALYALQTNPTYRAALGASIPGFVNSVFGDGVLRQTLGQMASVGVVNLVRAAGVDTPVIDAAVGQATYAAVTSLMADASVAQLVSTLAVGALSAIPNSVLVDTALHAVLTEFGLQAAIGFALGRGVGALFGDSIVAQAFGEIAGAAATLVIATVAGVTRLFAGDFSPPAAASINTGHFFVTLPVAGDLYVVNANA